MNAGDGMIASIGLFGGDFAPRSYALCQGQLLPINTNTALFSIIGTIYGGDGRTTFALPDLRGRVPMGNGNGPGLTPRRLGSRGGSETTTLAAQNIPTMNGYINLGNAKGDKPRGPGRYIAKVVGDDTGSGTGDYTFTDTPPSGSDVTAAGSVKVGGGGLSFNNVQPFLVMNYIIALVGVFPSRS